VDNVKIVHRLRLVSGQWDAYQAVSFGLRRLHSGSGLAREYSSRPACANATWPLPPSCVDGGGLARPARHRHPVPLPSPSDL